MEAKIAERNFIVEAPQKRVWDLLGPALLNSPIGLERMEVLDENHVRAETRLRFASIPITLHLLVVVLELLEPERMVVALNSKALAGLVCLDQKIVFSLRSKGDHETEVIIESIAERINPLVFWAMAKKAKSMAKTTLEGIEQTLKRLA
jgi:hypothetical protein